MAQLAAGLLFALAVGAGCRWFGVPSPSPPKLVGAALAASMALGFVAADWAPGS